MSQQNSATPWPFIRALEHKFKVEVVFDLACTTLDKKAEHGYFFDQGVDALKEDWSSIHVPVTGSGIEPVAFLNPPWKRVEKWARHCKRGTDLIVDAGLSVYDVVPGLRIFSLFPAGVGTNWFRNHVHGIADVYFLSPRLTYTDPRTGKPFVVLDKETGEPKLFKNRKTKELSTREQTGLNDAILCDWAGSGETFCWNWQEELDLMQEKGHTVNHD